MKSEIHLVTNWFVWINLYLFTDVNIIYIVIFVLWWWLFIDIDHPILYITKYKIFSVKWWIKKANELCKKLQAELYIFHSPEINLILIFLSIFSPLFVWISLSSLLHIALDIISHHNYHRNFKFIKNWSIFFN